MGGAERLKIKTNNMVDTKTKKTRASKKMTEAALIEQIKIQPLQAKLNLQASLKESIESDKKNLEAQLGLINGK